MLLVRVVQRLVILFIWLILLSIIGYLITVVNTYPLINLSIENYWLFIYSVFKEQYYYFHYMHTSYIISNILITFELVLVSLLFSFVVSWLLLVYALKRPQANKFLRTFFLVSRIAPFFIIILLFNRSVGLHISNNISQFDDSLSFRATSRVWNIFRHSDNLEGTLTLLLDFLSLAVTTSLFILPTVYLTLSKATAQIMSYSYVKSLTTRWSSFQLMRKAVNHRLIPIILQELPAIISSFMMIVGALEYLFGWTGIGASTLTFLQNKTEFGIEVGLVVFLLGAAFIAIYFVCNLLCNLYDINHLKELPYELD